MATRSIVTSHPDVACDVCGRRLLRGEQPDIFLAGGRRRTVCELCVPRAAHEGWLREADGHLMSVRPPRGRRGVSLFGRLRALREPNTESIAPSQHSFAEPAISDAALYDFLDGGSVQPAEPYEQDIHVGVQETADRGLRGEATVDLTPVTSGDLKIARAVEVFNAGDQPRRVIGVARSLGAPSVTVRPLEGSGSLIGIVVAWELCWYRYEVDLGDESAGARLIDKGLELSQLDELDQAGNAVADERGELALL